MRRTLLILILSTGSMLFTTDTYAAPTLVFTFQPGASYKACATGLGKGGNSGGCWTVQCSTLSPSQAPDNCFSRAYVDMIDANYFSQVKSSYDSQIASLTNLVQAYKDQIAHTHRDLVDTLIADPQFRDLLAEKIKKDANNR